MTMLILTPEQAAEIEELNTSGPRFHKIEPVELPDGRFALNSDLLMDLDPGETWWHYRIRLLDLPAETVTRFVESVAARA